MNNDLSLETLQDAILSVKSYAKYGNIISRAKMLSYGDVFDKMHDLINPQINQDYTITFYALSTIKDFMKY